jgi:hypothetical protein
MHLRGCPVVETLKVNKDVEQCGTVKAGETVRVVIEFPPPSRS